MSRRPYWRATPAQRRALLRLPLPEKANRADDKTPTRRVWLRITRAGWAEWDKGRVLRRTPAGSLAIRMTQEQYENELSMQLEEAEQDRQEAGQSAHSDPVDAR